jgi:hypothetical protein
MKRLALAAVAAALICSSALAQTTNRSGPPLPQNPNGATSNSADDNGINPVATPGAGPSGAVIDSTRSGDNGAYARENAGRSSGQSNSATPNPAPGPRAPDPRAQE